MSDSQFSGYLWFQVLIFQNVYMVCPQAMLLLLHSAFMLRVVKMLLKEEVGGSAFNSHGNYIVIMENHGKIKEIMFFEFLWEPCISHTICFFFF